MTCTPKTKKEKSKLSFYIFCSLTFYVTFSLDAKKKIACRLNGETYGQYKDTEHLYKP